MEKYRNTESNNNNNNLDLIRISCLRNPRITKGKGTWCHITSCTSMQTSWMSCSWFWAPWQPYPMGSSSPHCLLSRKEWSTRSEIWSQIHSFCTRELARIQHILCMSPLWAGLPTTLVSIHFLKFSLDFSYLFHTCAFHWSTFQEKDIKYIITYGHGDACSTSIRSFFMFY
jgi:hypothetical protein